MDFREAVRVIWPGEVGGVVTRAVNLSAAGILVDAPTPTPCPVGSDVLCDVALPRGQRLLRGRVAHRRLLSPAKIGMGIEFVELSAREAAELRDVVGEGEERPQRVKVRFEGTDQIVRARAQATEHGFRLATALPFLKAGTGVDIALSPDARASARGWVASVGLDRTHVDGAPRLVIDVRVDEKDPWGVATPVVDVEPEAVPEHVWELDELGGTPVGARASLDAPLEVAEAEDVPTVVTAAVPLPVIVEASAPTEADEHDRTEVISLTLERPRSRWAALRAGMIAGAIAFTTFAIIFFATRTAPPRSEPAPSISPPVILTQPAAPAAAAPVAAPPVAVPAPVPAAEPPAAAPADDPSEFSLDLVGSLAGARRYQLRNPDGVAYNLPHAKPTLPLGTHHPKVPGLRAVWLRPLPGGGTNARFFYSGDAAPPRVELDAGLIRVTPAE